MEFKPFASPLVTIESESSLFVERERRRFGGPCLRRVESEVFAINSARR